jgi:hypothetical protein
LSTITITAPGTTKLRVTWSSGNGNPVYTNQCAYTVAAAGATYAAPTRTPAAMPAAAVTSTAAGAHSSSALTASAGGADMASARTALLAAGLAALLPLLRARRPGGG